MKQMNGGKMHRRTPHSFSCPKCGRKARTIISRVLTDNTREKRYQCSNIFCSSTFVTHETLSHFLVETKAKNDN